jgi:hypothetical protein
MGKRGLADKMAGYPEKPVVLQVKNQAVARKPEQEVQGLRMPFTRVGDNTPAPVDFTQLI